MTSDGAILIDKHHGMTSFDVVSSLRKTLRIRRMGHCGTLDPIASGLVIVCFGRATKLVRFISAENKQYIADLMLGKTTATYDRYGVTVGESEVEGVSQDEVEAVLGSFLGNRLQAVPHHSALKYRGRPMYEYARQGINIPDRVREVTIHTIRLLEFASPHVILDVTCSKGTYVRSLAHEVGQKLGCGAHVFSLRRICIGNHRVEDALTLAQVSARKKLGFLDEVMIDMSDLLEFPSLTVVEPGKSKIAHGIDVLAGDVAGISGQFDVGDRISLVDSTGRLLAVGNALAGSSDLAADTDHGTPVFEYIRVI